MSLINERHLQGVTVENIMEYQKEVFSLYAEEGRVKIGFNGYSQFVVKDEGEEYIFNNPAKAIDKYTELVREYY